MLHRIKSIGIPEGSFYLTVKFDDGERKEIFLGKIFDEHPAFSKIVDKVELMKSLKIDKGGYAITWGDELDISADYLYENNSNIIHVGGIKAYDETLRWLTLTEVCISGNVRDLAEPVMEQLGIDFDTAINVFLYQVYYTKSIPFPVKLAEWKLEELKK